jgi:Family of unknown function (DUF6489)
MKVTINIDCTPQEARAFMGLPDLAPLHDEYIEKMRQLMTANMSGADAEKMVGQWSTMASGMEQWQKAMWGAATGATSKS